VLYEQHTKLAIYLSSATKICSSNLKQQSSSVSLPQFVNFLMHEMKTFHIVLFSTDIGDNFWLLSVSETPQIVILPTLT